ncbi:MAG TPA: hypothetical protein PKH32_08965 [Verrucomicrobiota bacterium]|nr:hypothetical protein [Verrucomicrobiota bacterium]
MGSLITRSREGAKNVEAENGNVERPERTANGHESSRRYGSFNIVQLLIFG